MKPGRARGPEAPLESPGDEARFIKELWRRGYVEKALATLDECFVAVRNKQPDGNVRSRVAELVLAYAIGQPVKRQEIVTHNVPRLEDLERQLAGSPAARATLRRMLDRGDTIDLSDEDLT